jgi:MFS family permease
MNCLAIIFFYMVLNLFSPFGVFVMETYRIGAGQLGTLTTAFILGRAIFSYFAGNVTDKLGPRLSITFGIIAVTIFTIIFPLIRTYELMLVVRFIQGAGAGFIMVPAIAAGLVWFPAHERGFAQGVLFGVLNLGFAVAVGMGLTLTQLGYNWQQASAILGCNGFVLAVIFYLLVKNFRDVYNNKLSVDSLLIKNDVTDIKSISDELKNISSKAWREALLSRKFWSVQVVMFANCWIIFGMAAFIPLILSEHFHLDPARVAALSTVTFIAGMIATPLGGLISDRILKKVRWPILFLAFLMALVFNSFIGISSLKILPVMLFFAYWSMPFMNGALWSLPAEIIHPSIANKAAGLWMFIGLLGGVIVAPIAGLVIDITGNYLNALYVFMVMGIIGLISSLGVRPN